MNRFFFRSMNGIYIIGIFRYYINKKLFIILYFINLFFVYRSVLIPVVSRWVGLRNGILNFMCDCVHVRNIPVFFACQFLYMFLYKNLPVFFL